MAVNVLILGDGAAGTIMANKLRFLTSRENAEITVIGNSKYHYFKPDGIHIPLGKGIRESGYERTGKCRKKPWS